MPNKINNQMYKQYKESLLLFFENAENITNLHLSTLQQRHIIKYFQTAKGLGSSLYSINAWRRSLMSNKAYESEIYKAKGIDECLDVLDKLLVPRKIEGYKGIELKKKNRKWNKYPLFNLFIDYKDYKEFNPSISIQEYISSYIDAFSSKKGVINYKARLIGLSPETGEKKFSLPNSTIRKINNTEKLEMINNYEKGVSDINPIEIVRSDKDTCIYEYWLHGTVNFQCNSQKTDTHLRTPKDAIQKVEKEIEKVLRTFRLYKSFEIGIRGFYIQVLHSKNSNYSNKWKHEEYQYEDFHKLEKIMSGSFSRRFRQNNHHRFFDKDIVGLNNTYNLLDKYYKTPIDQISQAINYFCHSFEQNKVIYVFTDLMMALESMLNNPEKSYLKKKDALDKLQIAIKGIQKLDTKEKNHGKKISNEFFKLQSYKGIQKTLKIGKQIFSTDKSRQKTFNDFFDPGAGGVYKLRNTLLHGNISGKELHEQIIKVLPQLSEYIRVLLKKIISISQNDKLMNSKNYFDKIKVSAKS